MMTTFAKSQLSHFASSPGRLPRMTWGRLRAARRYLSARFSIFAFSATRDLRFRKAEAWRMADVWRQAAEVGTELDDATAREPIDLDQNFSRKIKQDELWSYIVRNVLATYSPTRCSRQTTLRWNFETSDIADTKVTNICETPIVGTMITAHASSINFASTSQLEFFFLQRDMPRCAMLERSTVEDSASDSLVLFSQDNGLGKSRLGSVVIKFSFYVTACRHIPVTFLFYNILWFSLKLLSEYLMADIFWSLLRFRGCRGGASWVNFGNVLYVEPGRFSSNRASSPLVSVGRSYQTSYQDACVCV